MKLEIKLNDNPDWFCKKWTEERIHKEIIKCFNNLQEPEVWNYNYFSVIKIKEMIKELKSRADETPIGSQYSLFDL